MYNWIQNTLQLNSIMQAFFGVGIFGSVSYVIRLVRARNKSIDAMLDKQVEILESQQDLDKRMETLEGQGELRRKASLASLHDRIYQIYETVLDRGAITFDELDNLENLWRPYEAQGGNGSGQRMYERVKALPMAKLDSVIRDTLREEKMKDDNERQGL